jgi:hypothetical protein
MIMKYLGRLFSRGPKPSSRKAAAYHEAGHVVAALHSNYHNIVHTISVEDYGAGETFISVSKEKCRAAGKKASQVDPDIVKEFAVILKAGLAAEIIAGRIDTSVVGDATASKQDDELLTQQLRIVGIQSTPDLFLSEASKMLVRHWDEVDALAKRLVVGPVEAVDILFP